MTATVTTRDLTPARWPDFEALFESANGVCGGCWCMFWRIPKGERYADVKGPRAKRAMKKLVLAGGARGVLAYAGREPVGWLSYGPRRDYPKLDRAPSLKVLDADRVWSLPCFFVKSAWRGKGVATVLLDHALRSLAKAGAGIAEAYPVKVEAGKPAPQAFVYTGVPQLFARFGFEVAQARPRGKQRMRKILK